LASIQEDLKDANQLNELYPNLSQSQMSALGNINVNFDTSGKIQLKTLAMDKNN